jgi:gliding motility-associated-like protein
MFTPNFDGINDYFSITVNQPVKCELTIVNRWGNEVYRFEGGLHIGENKLWDGFVTLFHGDLIEGVYFYKLIMKELKIDNGSMDNVQLKVVNCQFDNCTLKKEGFVTVVR